MQYEALLIGEAGLLLDTHLIRQPAAGISASCTPRNAGERLGIVSAYQTKLTCRVI